MRSPNRPSISITLPKTIYDWIDAEAEKTNRSRSKMIAAIVQSAMENSNSEPVIVAEDKPPYTASLPTSPIDYITACAREGQRTLGLDPHKSLAFNLEQIRSNHPKLYQSLEQLALLTPADPSMVLPFDERTWPFSLDELLAVRQVYTHLWYRCREPR